MLKGGGEIHRLFYLTFFSFGLCYPMNKELRSWVDDCIKNDRWQIYKKIGERSISFGVTHYKHLPYTFASCKEYILDGTQGFLKEGGVITNTPIMIATKPSNIDKIKSVLHQVESFIGFELSTFDTEKDVFALITGDKRWSIAPPTLSLYASLMRLAIYVESTDNIVEKLLTGKVKSDFITDNSVYNHPWFTSVFSELKNIEEHFHDNLSSNYVVDDNPEYVIHGLGIYQYLLWLERGSQASYYTIFQKITKKTFDKIEK